MAVSAAQVNREPVDKMQRFFGGHIYLNHYGKNPIWLWKTTGVRARGIMMTLFSLLSRRRKKQIAKALAQWRIVHA